MFRSLLVALSLSFIVGCTTTVEQSSGNVLENAGSVIRTGKKNLWLPPEGQSAAGVESSTGRVLGNAGSVVRSGKKKLWDPQAETAESAEEYAEEEYDRSNRY